MDNGQGIGAHIRGRFNLIPLLQYEFAKPAGVTGCLQITSSPLLG